MKGRKPTPVELRVVRGNPSKRPIPEVAAVPKLKRLTPPPGMSEGAQAAWKKVAPMLQDAGLLYVPDVIALRLLCEAYSTWEDATERARAGLLVKAGNGTPMPSPYLAIASRAHDQIYKLLAEFGMTPSGRARIGSNGGVPSGSASGGEPASETDAKEKKFFG